MGAEENLPYIREESPTRQAPAIKGQVKVFCSKFELDHKEKLLIKRGALFGGTGNGARASGRPAAQFLLGARYHETGRIMNRDSLQVIFRNPNLDESKFSL